MEFQSLFDSVCRCFGHPPTAQGGTASSPSAASQPIADTTSQSSVKRRTNRLELKDKQWDELFEKKKHQQKGTSPTKSSRNADDLGTAQAVAQAKLAANPPRNRSKRKRSVESREEIFRSKEQAAEKAASNAAHNSFSRLLHPSLALCFATPVRGTEDEPDEMDMRSVDNSDTNTLNTCEDTITSTVYFENKYSHVVETRPPMPLFHQFKLGTEKDEIRNIMASDSHSSVRMIKLLQQPQLPVQLEEDSSNDSADDRRKRSCPEFEMEDAVPDVKAVSSSTDSSRQSQPRP